MPVHAERKKETKEPFSMPASSWYKRRRNAETENRDTVQDMMKGNCSAKNAQ